MWYILMDGKLLRDIAIHEILNRLVILSVWTGNSKLLAMPKLVSRTSFQVTEAVVTCLEDWNMTEDISICFYTSEWQLRRLKNLYKH